MFRVLRATSPFFLLKFFEPIVESKSGRLRVSKRSLRKEGIARNIFSRNRFFNDLGVEFCCFGAVFLISCQSFSIFRGRRSEGGGEYVYVCEGGPFWARPSSEIQSTGLSDPFSLLCITLSRFMFLYYFYRFLNGNQADGSFGLTEAWLLTID